MTTEQRTTLMGYWWPAAAAAQGWDKNDRAKRLAVLSQAVNRPLSSASDLDNRADIDAVKAHLKSLTSNLAATIETLDPTIGEARRIRHIVRAEILPCLSLYESDPQGYLATIITDLIRWNKTDRPTRPPTLEDLDAKPILARKGPCHALRQSPSQLHQAMMTLNARLHSKRKAAGHTIHDMLTQAGVFCDCRKCEDARFAAEEHAAGEVHEVPVENQPF